MEEQLISFETAKLAKEKGFGGKGLTTANGYFRGENLCIIPCNNKSDFCAQDEYSAPTQSLLQKWLREEHNSIVEIVYSKQDYTSPIKFESTVDYFTKELEYEITIDPEFRSKKFLKYEDALEIGLFNALKLIK